MAGTRCEAFPPLRALPRSSGVCAEVAAPARLRGALRRFLCPTHRHLSNTSLKLHCQPTPWQHSAQQPRFCFAPPSCRRLARPRWTRSKCKLWGGLLRHLARGPLRGGVARPQVALFLPFLFFSGMLLVSVVVRWYVTLLGTALPGPCV